jgi:(E)-4-hydroxy-3-methylbut-2-enyl-diphosphate synthase
MTEAAVQERPITSRQIVVGGVPIGGGAQVAVQSMTNTMTHDVEATVQQVYDLNAAGADLVRVSVNGIQGPARASKRSLAHPGAPDRRHPLRLPDGPRGG